MTCVGTVPDPDAARALAQWLAPVPRGGWQQLPASVTALTGTAPDGRRIHIVHNWSWDPAVASAPCGLVDLLANGSDQAAKAGIPAGAPVELGPWDVRVFAADQ